MNTETKGLLALVVVAVVAVFGIYTVKDAFQDPSGLGTAITYNADNGSYTEGADLRQNVQAIAERMSGLTSGQLLQADSSGHIQAVSPSALAGTSWSFDALYTDALSYLEPVEAITASNTIAVTESGKTFYMSGATSIQTLPTSTTAGQVYRFVVGGSVTGDITIVTSGAENVINGTLIVAGAVVDCDAEDTITVVADGENVGDFVELRSNGTGWFIGASGALTASKLTCTAT